MSAPINAPRKPVLDLPRGYVAFTRTPTFNPLTLPPGLRDSHRTSRGVWGEIVIEQGAVRYDWLDGSGESWDLEAGEVGVIPAGVPHRVKPMSEDTRFYLQLFHVDGVVEKDLKREENGRIALDLRPLPRPLRHQAIFSAFDALGPGDSLTFINDHDPGPLLGQFSVLRRRCFLWLPQTAEGDRWTVCVCSRRADTEPSIGEALQADHIRLDELMTSAANVAQADEQQAEVLRDFGWGLRRHIQIEEQRLFPLFLKAGGEATPIQVMEHEHRDIERRLQLLGSRTESARSTLTELRKVLEQHNFKEEAVLYPMLDDALAERRGELVETVFREIG